MVAVVVAAVVHFHSLLNDGCNLQINFLVHLNCPYKGNSIYPYTLYIQLKPDLPYCSFHQIEFTCFKSPLT